MVVGESIYISPSTEQHVDHSYGTCMRQSPLTCAWTCCAFYAARWIHYMLKGSWALYKDMQRPQCITSMEIVIQIHAMRSTKKACLKISRQTDSVTSCTFSGSPVQRSEAIFVTNIDCGNSSRQHEQLRHQCLHLALHSFHKVLKGAM